MFNAVDARRFLVSNAFACSSGRQLNTQHFLARTLGDLLTKLRHKKKPSTPPTEVSVADSLWCNGTAFWLFSYIPCRLARITTLPVQQGFRAARRKRHFVFRSVSGNSFTPNENNVRLRDTTARCIRTIRGSRVVASHRLRTTSNDRVKNASVFERPCEWQIAYCSIYYFSANRPPHWKRTMFRLYG